MRIMRIFFFLLGPMFVLSTSAFSTGPNMQEGNWEITMEMKMDMPGMPFQMPPMTFTHTQCLTKEEIVPNTAKKDERCIIKDQKIIGNTVKWKVVCDDKASKTEGDGEITYSGTSFKGNIITKIIDKQSGQVTNSTTKMTGRRTGECKK